MSFIALAMLACVDEDPFFDPSADTADHFQEDELQPVESGRRVSQARLRCSTRHVLGLSYQVVGEMRCMDPDSLIELPPGDGIDYVFSSVMPYFAPEAAERLREVAAVQPLEVVSGYRTVIQQHVIAAWYEYGTCTVKDAAEPGTSRHESGRAIDIRNYVEAEDTLGKHGWTPLAGDRGHYDFMAAPDLAGIDVEAFQRLWNRNHPEDPIAEDGDYGKQTARRIERSPADGFPIGPTCAP